MAERATPGRVYVLSRAWADAGAESSFVLRGLAGALSRHAAVDVVVPGPPGPPVPDGLFDLQRAGQGVAADSWPRPEAASWPERPPGDYRVALIESGDVGAVDLLQAHAPGLPIAAVRPPLEGDGWVEADVGTWIVAAEGGQSATNSESVGFHVPVNPLASVRRHNGLGFTGYLLVLTDRPGLSEHELPTDAVAWLTARFPGQHVVVVEAARAAVWQGRALRGVITVDSRTDLWRLMAHARVTIDLRPGPLIARETVESLRFGTPVVVPADSVAAVHARRGGGLWYSGTAALLGCIEALEDDGVQHALGVQGRRSADALFGRPGPFVDRVGEALAS